MSKRLLDDSPGYDDSRHNGPLKRVKRTELFQWCEKEWAFFANLWPYEQMRWLYAFVGLCDGGLLQEIVRTVLVDWMHLQCVSQTGNRLVPPLTERIYRPEDGQALFDAMRSLEREALRAKVETERLLLLGQGVPERNLCLVHANFPHDGSGAICRYRHDWPVKYRWPKNVHLPDNLEYACLDCDDTAGIQARVGSFRTSLFQSEHRMRDIQSQILRECELRRQETTVNK